MTGVRMNVLSKILMRHARAETTQTALPRLMLARSDSKRGPIAATYEAVLGIVAEGRKRVMVGSESFLYEPLSYMVASVSLPVTGVVVETPYLALALKLDLKMLAEVVQAMPPVPAATNRAYGIARLEGPLLDAVVRYARLLDSPEHAGILAPLIEREIHYWLLLGPRGDMLRQLSRPSSQLSHINRAVAVIRAQYKQPLHAAELAQVAHMSEASLHRHFKAATGMSPLQFQKQLRLQEARRLLLSNDRDAASVGYEVGYESPSQFGREYRRLFGTPPGRDSQRGIRSPAMAAFAG